MESLGVLLLATELVKRSICFISVFYRYMRSKKFMHILQYIGHARVSSLHDVSQERQSQLLYLRTNMLTWTERQQIASSYFSVAYDCEVSRKCHSRAT